jgi:hypothetical protein
MRTINAAMSNPEQHAFTREQLQERSLRVRYILDKFKVSDQAYQALTSLDSMLPKGFKVKCVRKELNDELRREFDLKTSDLCSYVDVEKKTLAADAKQLLENNHFELDKAGDFWFAKTPLSIKIQVCISFY